MAPDQQLHRAVVSRGADRPTGLQTVGNWFLNQEVYPVLGEVAGDLQVELVGGGNDHPIRGEFSQLPVVVE